jgi:predicted ribosome quality control (RQC) complex YloA/Tae2 family protein
MTELARLDRKQALLTVELTTAQNADELRKCADTLMTYLPSIEARSQQIVLPDLYGSDPDQNKLTIALDPRLSPVENAQAYYSRYNKQKRALDQVASQISQCHEEKAYLESIQIALEHSATNAEAADIRLELTEAGYLPPVGKRRPPIAVSQPLSGNTTDGIPLLIGKNNRQNDLVTFKQAHVDDIWLHTKDIPGSHVILRTGSLEPSAEALRQAAQVAAFFSKARASSNVPVDYTRRRYVKKPSGAKPGFVIYERQTTLFVTPDETLIRQLLKN